MSFNGMQNSGDAKVNNTAGDGYEIYNGQNQRINANTNKTKGNQNIQSNEGNGNKQQNIGTQKRGTNKW